MTEPVQIIIAWVTQTAIIAVDRNQFGEVRSVQTGPHGHALLWAHRGSPDDIRSAERFAQAQDLPHYVFTYLAEETGAKGKAIRAVLRSFPNEEANNG